MHGSASLFSSLWLSRVPRVLLWTGSGIAGALLGLGLLVQQAVERERNEFETGARIAHRLLSQCAVQHEAALATLTLMQPTPNARLPAAYPQLMQVWRRSSGQAWPVSPQLRTALEAAETAAVRPTGAGGSALRTLLDPCSDTGWCRVRIGNLVAADGALDGMGVRK